MPAPARKKRVSAGRDSGDGRSKQKRSLNPNIVGAAAVAAIGCLLVMSGAINTLMLTTSPPKVAEMGDRVRLDRKLPQFSQGQRVAEGQSAGGRLRADFELGGWPLRSESFHFKSDGHDATLLTISEQPQLKLVRGLLTAEEVAGLQKVLLENFDAGKFVDRSQKMFGERNATWMWAPEGELYREGALMQTVDSRMTDLCIAADGEATDAVAWQLETGCDTCGILTS